MLYLLDANTLIDAKRDYYQFDRVPEFWEWLVYQGEQGYVKIAPEIYDEFIDKKPATGESDALSDWAGDASVKGALLLNEQPDMAAIQRVLNAYMAAPTDEDLRKMGRDPFLISYALKDINNRCIVTSEGSRPKRKDANRHVPDVCKDLGVKCVNSFRFPGLLDFSTNWKKLLATP